MARRAVHSQAEGGVPRWVSPMLASPDGGQLREGPEWAYEYKLDFCTGFQAVVDRDC